MTRARRQRERSGDITDAAWAMLTDQPVPADTPGWEVWHLRSYPGPVSHDGKLTLEGLWPLHGRTIVEEWAVEHPGTRPSLWWCWDAPRLPGVINHDRRNRSEEATEPRLRLGGVGTPDWSAGRRLGIPADWMTPWHVAYYNGRCVNVEGEPIGTEYREGDCTDSAPDPRDPPRFESQAAYLVRFKRLLPGERARLTEADFEPEVMDAQGWLDRLDADAEADRQRRIEIGHWAGDPAGWTGIRAPR